MAISYIENGRGQKLAYVSYAGDDQSLPTLMFLGGFRSDMQGTKALFLEEKCRARGQPFIRFDYTGHGESDGLFEEGTIGQWKDDALCVLDTLVQGDVVLVGSSMGGWISLLLLLERSDRIQGAVGIAAAPDFTKEIEERLSAEQKDIMVREGCIEVPNDYSDDPYVFTRDLIVDGADYSLLDGSYSIDVPLILVQGKQDADVSWKKALKIQEVFKGHQTDVVFVADGDHRLSKPAELDIIWDAVLRI